MPAESLGNLTILVPLTIVHATAESFVVPPQASKMRVGSADVVNLRFSATGNDFRIPANDTASIDVSCLRGQTLYLYNPAGSGSATVTLIFKNRSAI